ncbi:MAG: RNA polymerase sigma factor [Solirubrobacterales bacterium]
MSWKLKSPMLNPAQQDRFVLLVDEHRKILHKVARCYAWNPADREELVQEITLQLWRSFDRYDEHYKFPTWMYRIALNVAISFVRTEVRRTRSLVPADDSTPSVLDLAATPEPADDDLRLLDEFIQKLDDLDRALVLLYLDGHRHETIAEILGISATNVGTKIGRIKQRIRRDWPGTN